ncbi:hypothetical protein [Luteolibacter soli]|uniref:Uncharacterized protein n=1 Tax=Luteolibacter soli TaxID=3135280 RepID=A0ABU9AX97_9BACT
MKPLFLALLLSVVLKADETQFFYAPTWVRLTGVIVKSEPEGEATPAGDKKASWILRLPQPVTVNPKEGSADQILETDVSEVRIDAGKWDLAEVAGLKSSVICHGTLSRDVEGDRKRPIVLKFDGYQPVAAPTREIRRSPDGKMFVAWADQQLGPPFGEIRSIFLRYANDQDTLFSVVSSPRDTKAGWNPGSSRCIIADAPDNGGPRTWLVTHESPDVWEWKTRVIEPFGKLEKEFRESDPDVHQLFRCSIFKIEWLSDTKVRFRAWCNTGTYFLTMDTDHPEAPPVEEKLSDEFLKE